MIVFILTAGTLLAAFLCHLAWWWVRVPVHQLRVLLVVFGLFFVASSGLVVMRPAWTNSDHVWLVWLYFAVFYWAAAFCYVITYSAMEGDSPTLSLTRELARRGEQGMTREDLEEFFAARPFIGARIAALVKDGVLVSEEGGYRLAPRSYWFFRLILGYRRLMFGNIKDGG